MMIMPGNDSSGVVHFLCGRHPGEIGWIQGPSSFKKPRWYMPYAVDNDAFSAWENGTEWSESKWLNMLDEVKLGGIDPLWALVPDVVGDREKTIERWHKYKHEIVDRGIKTAFAAQDGMSISDIPECDVVFVGGTTKWKWEYAPSFCLAFNRVHIGRVNTLSKLWECKDMGAESVDGTGWFREGHDGKRMEGLLKYFNGQRE